jgi:hypothetical protein
MNGLCGAGEELHRETRARGVTLRGQKVMKILSPPSITLV